MGADDPGKCELDPAVFGRADLVVVDSRAAAAGIGVQDLVAAETALALMRTADL